MEPDGTKSGGHGSKKHKVDEFILALLDHPSVDAAADAARIGKTTAWRWLKDPDILARYREARRDAMQHAMSRLQAVAGQSVETLAELQRSAESEAVRASAARTVLEQAMKAVELGDIQRRLDALEAVVKSRNWKGLSGNDRENRTPARPPGGVNGPM
jgi:hypothetical protein